MVRVSTDKSKALDVSFLARTYEAVPSWMWGVLLFGLPLASLFVFATGHVVIVAAMAAPAVVILAAFTAYTFVVVALGIIKLLWLGVCAAWRAFCRVVVRTAQDVNEHEL